MFQRFATEPPTRLHAISKRVASAVAHHAGMRLLTAHLLPHRRRDIGPLLDVPALRDAGRRSLADLAPHADRVRLPAGRTIARAGDTARELTAVVAGQAALLSRDGRTAVLSAGAEIGGREVVDRRPHSGTVVSLTDVEVVVVRGPAVLWAQREGLLRLSTREEDAWTRSTWHSSRPVALSASSS
jgi:CRP-like cAMP-binding protein